MSYRNQFIWQRAVQLAINCYKFTEERQRAEGSYAEGKKVKKCHLPKGFKAPKFIYETRKKYVFRDA